MPSTYEPIATTTLGSAAATITFSSIPATYTDLRVVGVGTFSTSGDFAGLRFNLDAGSNYSATQLQGNGTAASSTRWTSQDNIYLSDLTGSSSTTIPQLIEIDVFSYAGSTNKTALVSCAGDRNGSGVVIRYVGLWRNTAAITSVRLMMPSGGQFATGYTATLYGIKNA
jgi:hypothetical protein